MDCVVCGDKIETPGRTGACFGCILDSMIPPDYLQREEYAYDEAYGHQNATQHPPTGVEILDSTPLRLSQILIPRNPKLPAWLGRSRA